MARVTVQGLADSGAMANGSPLTDLLLAQQIDPGDPASYEVCKAIYLYHPLGGKMADAPITWAQAQERDIAVPDSPEDRVVRAFKEEWERVRADNTILQAASTARMYGASSLAFGAKGKPTDRPIDPWSLHKLELYFNVFDPLNTAGSLVLNQDPNAPDFQKPTMITAGGQAYHRSRTVILMNERPVYLAFSSSTFGYTGRSVYQRALYPLQSFLRTMITDDMVATKAGLLVVKMKQGGSIATRMMSQASEQKREMLKGAATNNVMNIGHEDDVASLDLQNIDGAAGFARTNILKNIATAADMPAVMLENETLTEGFGEGVEDAKIIAQYVDGIRKWMKPIYDFMDNIVMHRAWSPEFYATIQAEYPESWAGVDYQTAFYRWKNSFTANWPNLLKEPDSDLVAVDEIKLKAIVSLLGALGPTLDPDNKAQLIAWAADNLNELKLMFPDPLLLDVNTLIPWLETQKPSGEEDGAEPLTLGR